MLIRVSRDERRALCFEISKLYDNDAKGVSSCLLGLTLMLVLITYDVSTVDASGKRRLRNVAKKCVAHGQRVQNSVFECYLDAAQYKQLRSELAQIIELEQDSLRFYILGNHYQTKVDHIGAKASYKAEEFLSL